MDQVMHGGYLRRFAPQIRRQIVVLNRSDLLSPEDARRVANDMSEQLHRDGAGAIDVVVTRAREGAGGVAMLREWLESAVEAKAVVVARVAAEVREAVRDLAAEAGVADGSVRPAVESLKRERALHSVTRGTLALIDIEGLERQAVAATRFAARRRGAGPMRHLTSAIYRLTGRARASADPAGFLNRWQLRGSLAPAVEPLRELVTSTLPSVPAPLRRRLAQSIELSLVKVADGFRARTCWLWPVIGAAQCVVRGFVNLAVQ